MIIQRCPKCKVSWEDGQPAKHLMTCTAKYTVTSHGYHRKPTEMESRAMTAMAGLGIGDDRFEVARAVIRAMRDVGPIAKALPFLVHTGGHGEPKPPHPLVAWAEMIDAASPQEE